ncbi:MAG: glutathione peroxidase [Spirochaetaceae bacterium]|nr:glutathione peroxidase [Spirochaetaceae bacterium]
MSVYKYFVKTMDGKEISMEKYKGKVLLILNSATHCGFTIQYTGLQELYSKYKDEGFEILDFPCNQFGGQAPETNEEIHDFCVKNYGITFEQFSKIDVNGDNTHPLFSYLRCITGKFPGAEISWNFTKFLIGKDGLPVKQFAPPTQPKDLEQEIISELKK